MILNESLFEASIISYPLDSNTKKQIDSDIKDAWGADYPGDGCIFIHPDGSFLNIYPKLDDHEDLCYWLEDEGYDSDYIVEDASWFTDTFNYIRCRNSMHLCFTALPESKVTSAQLDSLERWIEEKVTSDYLDVVIEDSSEQQHYNLDEYFPEDIISKIKRYYSSGRLYEEINRNKEKIPANLKKFILNNQNLMNEDLESFFNSFKNRMRAGNYELNDFIQLCNIFKNAGVPLSLQAEKEYSHLTKESPAYVITLEDGKFLKENADLENMEQLILQDLVSILGMPPNTLNDDDLYDEFQTKLYNSEIDPNNYFSTIKQCITTSNLIQIEVFEDKEEAAEFMRHLQYSLEDIFGQSFFAEEDNWEYTWMQQINYFKR